MWDPYSNPNDRSSLKFDGWNVLLKIDGGANKSNDKADDFGIGKSVPFINSYFTKSISGLADQGTDTAITRTNKKLAYWFEWNKVSIEERQLLLFNLSEEIWGIVSEIS